MSLKVRLALMNFLEFAVWGAYLTSMGRYLGNIGMSTDIGWFYSMQGIVSIFMPALMGIIADRWIQAQRFPRLRQPIHNKRGIFFSQKGHLRRSDSGAHCMGKRKPGFERPELRIALLALRCAHSKNSKGFI